jgi:hypothetical protein
MAQRRKNGAYGTMFAFRVTYLVGDCHTATWATWAYDRRGAEERFADNCEGWDLDDIVKVEPIEDRP